MAANHFFLAKEIFLFFDIKAKRQGSHVLLKTREKKWLNPYLSPASLEGS